jgi:hypothetical protein
MTGFRNVGFTKPFTDNAGRLRVSQMTSLGDYKILNSDLQPLLMQYLGTGTVVNNVNRATLTLDGVLGVNMIAQTKMYHPYLNGKSQLVNMTVSNFAIETQSIKRFGYFSRYATPPYDPFDGFYLEGSYLTGYHFHVMRNGGSVSIQSRSAWADKLDGTGASGMDINWADFNIFAFDFLYLGGSCINCYVYYNGAFHLFNTYYHANTSTTPMFISPNKPLTWEVLTNSGIPATLDVICGEVAVEGINTDLGIGTAISSPIAGVNCVLAGTTYPLVGIRKKTTSRDIHAIIEGFEAQCSTTNDRIRLDIILNPDVLIMLGGSFTYSNLANSPLQVATPTGVVTALGGFVLDSSLITTNANVSKIIANPLRALCSTLDNTMDEIILCATPSLASTNVLATGYINAKWYT